MAQADPKQSVWDASFLLTLIASTFLMVSSFASGKVLLQEGFSPAVLVGGRFFVAAFATLPLLFLDNRRVWRSLFPPSFGLRDSAPVIFIVMLHTAAVMGLFFLAIQAISASAAAILLFTNPIWVALLDRLFLGESFNRGRMAGQALGVIGVALATGLGSNVLAGGPTLRGDVIGILSALCWAVATIVNKRANLPIGSWALSFWQMLIGSAAILAIACASGQHWPAVTVHSLWDWFFWLAVPASTGSFGLWLVALARDGGIRTKSYLFLASLLTLALSGFVLSASLSWLQAAGGLLIGVALWRVNREMPACKCRERPSKAPAEGRQ